MFVPKDQLRNTVASLTRALADAQLQRTQAVASYESVRDRASAEHARLEDEKQELAKAARLEMDAADRSLNRAKGFERQVHEWITRAQHAEAHASQMESVATQLVEERDILRKDNQHLAERAMASENKRGVSQDDVLEALRSRDLKIEELRDQLAYAKAQIQAQAVSIHSIHSDLDAARKATAGMHDMLRQECDLATEHADRIMELRTEHAELQQSLDWWIAEANRRGNVILGMSPADAEWPRVIAHDPESLSDHLVNTSVTVSPDTIQGGRFVFDGDRWVARTQDEIEEECAKLREPWVAPKVTRNCVTNPGPATHYGTDADAHTTDKCHTTPGCPSYVVPGSFLDPNSH